MAFPRFATLQVFVPQVTTEDNQYNDQDAGYGVTQLAGIYETIKDTGTVHTGFSISSSDVPDYALFVRAEIQGRDGTIYTQPFYLQ